MFEGCKKSTKIKKENRNEKKSKRKKRNEKVTKKLLTSAQKKVAK